MAINRPVTKTLISTSLWGIPITDEVNRLTAALAAAAPTPWTAIPLSAGWTSYAGYQAPAYRKVGDIVYCRGMLTIPATSSGTVIGTLPVGFRLTGAGTEYPAFYWNGAARAYVALTISSNGALYCNDAATVGSAMSLNLVSYSTL